MAEKQTRLADGATIQVGSQSLSLRSWRDADLPVLQQIYASTRAQELAQVPWSNEQKAAFVSQQFEAQHSYYQQTFTDAEFLVIQAGEEIVGRLYLDRRSDEIRLVDIALLPDHRNAGWGGAILNVLIDEANHRSLPLRIHVEHNNPAMRLYLRLGFQPVEDQGVYQLMEFSPVD